MIRCMGCMKEFNNEYGSCCPYCGYQIGQKISKPFYLLPGTVLNQRYLVGKVLGYGGFGVTYIGWDQILEREVAIKEYLPSNLSGRSYGELALSTFSEEAFEQFQAGLERFVSEARQLAQFNKISGIVQIYDCFKANDTGYIIMEFLQGCTVKELIKGKEVFPWNIAVSK